MKIKNHQFNLFSILLLCFVVGCSNNSKESNQSENHTETTTSISNTSDSAKKSSADSTSESSTINTISYFPGGIDVYSTFGKYEPYTKPSNIEDIAGSYEAEPQSSNNGTSKEKVELTITNEGYYTILYDDNEHSTPYYACYIDDQGNYKKNDATLFKKLVTGILKSEFNGYKLSRHSFSGDLETTFNSDGSMANPSFRDTNNNRDIAKYIYHRTPLHIEVSKNALEYVDYKLDKLESGELVLVNGDTTYSLKRIDSKDTITSKSLFQYFYDWAAQFKTLKFANKNEFYQAIEGNLGDWERNKEYDAELLNKKGFLPSGQEIAMKYISVGYSDYNTTIYGYDGNKVYSGKLNKTSDVIEWEEYSLIGQQFYNQIHNDKNVY